MWPIVLLLALGMTLAAPTLTASDQPADRRLAQSRSDRLRDLDAGKIPRVALIGLQPRPGATPFIEALEAGLMAAGYAPGRNIVVEYHSAEGRSDRLRDVAADVARRNVDIIVASTNEVILAAQRATTTIPIVMAVGGDPVGAGFVASLARPGGNITGLTFDAVPEAYAKPLEFLKEIQPSLTRVAVLRNPDPTFSRMAAAAVEAGRQIGITLTLIEVGDPREFESALARVKREGIRAVLVWPNGIVYGARQQLIELALRDRLLLASITRQFADDGALLTYGPSLFDIFRRTGFYVDRILKGARPGFLPVEQPSTFELIINHKTARALGLTIPPSLLLRADQVIER